MIYLNNLIDIDLQKSPQLIQNLTNLTELELFSYSYLRLTHFLCSISKFCNHLHKLVFRGNMIINLVTDKYVAIREANQVASLIKLQHNLIHLELFDINEEDIWKVIMESIIETQSNSLEVLIFNNVTICSKMILFHLKSLQNLKELRFNECIFRTNPLANQSKNSWEGLRLPKLESLEIDFTEETREDSKELTSILLGSFPLKN